MMERLGVSPDETMAFGDFVNDMSLMSACTHTYAMKNGHPDIIAAARHVTEKTNDENGVIYTIAKELNLTCSLPGKRNVHSIIIASFFPAQIFICSSLLIPSIKYP